MSEQNEQTLADEILNTDDSRSEQLYIPEWGKWVEVRSMTYKERFERRKQVSGMSVEDAGLMQLIYQTYDPKTGKRLFKDEHLTKLQKKNQTALGRIQQVVAKLNGLLDEEVEEIQKNSQTTPSDD